MMEALNLPIAKSSVTTFWEGEIVDNVNYSFFTRKWDASDHEDIEYWGRFPSFPGSQGLVIRALCQTRTNNVSALWTRGTS